MPNETTARLRQAIEEQLGEFRACAHLPATEIEAMAARLVRAVEPFTANAPALTSRAA